MTKRVGAHAMLLFLMANDGEPLFPPAELTQVTLAAARGEMPAEALAIWLEQRIRPRQP